MDTAASSGSAPANPAPVVDGFLDSKARIRIGDLQEATKRLEKWTMLTCHNAISARIFDNAKIPCLLVGDPASYTACGYDSTLPVTMNELIPIVREVSSSCERALVVADLPLGSYEESPRKALGSATRFIEEAGAHAVKLQGGPEYADHIRFLTQSGIPVMAHTGFTRKYIPRGYRVQGRTMEDMERLYLGAKSLESAGAFACVLEFVYSDLGRIVNSVMSTPLIAMRAGPGCDAQMLAWQDMAGFSPPSPTCYLRGAIYSYSGAINSSVAFLNEPARVPRIVEWNANLEGKLYKAAVDFRKNVRSGAYPGLESLIFLGDEQ